MRSTLLVPSKGRTIAQDIRKVRGCMINRDEKQNKDAQMVSQKN